MSTKYLITKFLYQDNRHDKETFVANFTKYYKGTFWKYDSWQETLETAHFVNSLVDLATYEAELESLLVLYGYYKELPE